MAGNKRDELEEIKRKLDKLETRLRRSSRAGAIFQDALFCWFRDKGLLDPKEFRAYLKKQRHRYERLDIDIEFWRLVAKLERKRKRK